VEVGKPRPELTKVFAGYAVVEIPIDKQVRVPVTLRVGCDVRPSQGTPQCIAAGVALQATMMLLLPMPFSTLPFQVDQVRGIQPVERMRAVVRFNTIPVLIDQVKVGDVDVGMAANELVAGAEVVQAPPSRQLGDAAQRDVTLILRAQKVESGWTYAASPLRAGIAFVLRTRTYELQGVVLQLTPEPSPAAERR
jgi:hypothetical protein